jgi:hypothetical protein
LRRKILITVIREDFHTHFFISGFNGCNTFARLEDVLYNPVYNALLSGDAHLSFGTKEVKYFDEQVSPFAGSAEDYTKGFDDLYHHLSLKEAAELTHNIYQLNVILPQSKHKKSIILKMDRDQDHLTELINKNC